MKLIFNLTVRTKIWSLPGSPEKEPCRKCSSCTKLSEIEIEKIWGRPLFKGSYWCEMFQAEVENATSEDSMIPCTLFKKIILKKL